jgi:hypothetical protein
MRDRNLSPAEGINLRSFLLRQAGLVDLCVRAQPCSSLRIALIDGRADPTHPSLLGCSISQLGDSRSSRASEHATFSASIITGGEADQTSGRVLAICFGCTLVNFAVVTEEMLSAGPPIRKVARTLAATVDLALKAKCQTIVFGVEIRQPESREWEPLRESIRVAVAAGSAVILPTGNRSLAQAATPCSWPEVIVTASRNWRGDASPFSPQSGRSGNTIFAPGENIPGAGPGSSYVIRSGSSFAAAVAAGAFGFASCLAPGRAVSDLAAELCTPPRRILDGAALCAKHSVRSEMGGLSCMQ